MFAIFLGLGRTRDFPIGMCMFDAYFYNIYIGPNETRFLMLSGLSAFPL